MAPSTRQAPSLVSPARSAARTTRSWPPIWWGFSVSCSWPAPSWQRRTVALRQADGLASDAVLRFLNRASDLVFAMARFADVGDPELFEGRDKGTNDG